MSTPQLPIITNGTVGTVKRDLSWLSHHLVITAVIVITLFLGVWGMQNLVEKHDEKNAIRAHEELAVVVDQVKRLETKQAADDAAAQQREAQYNTTIQTLIASINARDKVLDDQLKKNATLTAQQAAARLSDQYKTSPGEIT